jgi:D-alanyl-lipoteichoic acid acyltransferase DltB (MBOAT superfamily)
MLLLVSSYFFYAYAHWAHLFIMLLSTAISYAAGLGLAAHQVQRIRRLIMWSGVLMNMAILFYFKYLNFFSEEVSAAFRLQHIGSKTAIQDILLPIGISFYIFQTTGYIIDVYRNAKTVERNPARYALFVSFFPQLIAGPIERARNLLPQFQGRYDFDYDRIRAGVIRFGWGIFKKVVVADNLALYVNAVYASPADYEGITIWIATILFMYQMYYDFSAYADMAIGIGTILGIKLSENFTNKLPFMASSFMQFWQNWHITLTIWIRDYLYIPLVKYFRESAMRRFIPLLTFALIGLWHGAGWTFVVWGTLNGVYFVVEGLIRQYRDRKSSTGNQWRSSLTLKILGTASVFVLTVFAMLFFRAPSMEDAMYLLQAGSVPFLGNIKVLATDQLIVIGGMLIVAELIRVSLGTRTIGEMITSQKPWVRFLFYLVITELILLFAVPEGQDFIYFQF